MRLSCDVDAHLHRYRICPYKHRPDSQGEFHDVECYRK